LVCELDDLEVCLRVKDRGFDQETDERFAGVGVSKLGEALELVEVRLALGAEHLVEGARPEAGGSEQLEEEVVSVARLADERGRQPVVEFVAAVIGEPVEDAVGAARLSDAVGGDEAVADEAVEHLVEVADVEATPLRPDRFLELAAQDIAVAFALREKRKHGVLDRHRTLLPPDWRAA
jgi:hypothetical protein